MSWTKLNDNLYSHDVAPFMLEKIEGIWGVRDARDKTQFIPFSDIFNNPVFSIDFTNSDLIVKSLTSSGAIEGLSLNITNSSNSRHFRGEFSGGASTPSFSAQTDINTGFFSKSDGVFGFSSNGVEHGEFGNGFGGFTGNIIQVAYNEILTSGVYSSTMIPVDNTIPQQSEGAEILTCSITPRYANSILYIESNSFIGENTNNADSIVQALFRDSTADAISVSFNNANPVSSSPFGGGMSFNPTYMMAKQISGSILSTIFKLRAGAGSSAGDIRLNGSNGSQFFNGKLVTYIKITEVKT